MDITVAYLLRYNYYDILDLNFDIYIIL